MASLHPAIIKFCNECLNRIWLSSSPYLVTAPIRRCRLWLPPPSPRFQLASLSSSTLTDHCSYRCRTSLWDTQHVDAGVERQSLSMPFHLAIPVHDIQAARDFYGGILGLPEGRSAKTWVDFNLYGHQLVCHHVKNYNAESSANAVDGDPVPVPHFGLAMSVANFLELAKRVESGGVHFIIKPHIRFSGQPGEQWTMFFKDKSGNSLEFKAMTNPDNLFVKYVVED